MNPPDHAARLVLVLGGARSGKSRYAEDLALRSGLDPVYLATATDGGDPEMAARIARHRVDREERWRTVETQDVVAALRREANPGRVVLVDCLTLWLTAVMLGGGDVAAATADLCATLPALSGPAILVSNEVGQGIVPDNALARRFRDAQGRLNQGVAAVCDTVVLVAAGLPLLLKPAATPAVVLGATPDTPSPFILSPSKDGSMLTSGHPSTGSG